ncbi:MAG: hypothetical protein AB9836_04875 [Aminipila sp.]
MKRYFDFPSDKTVCVLDIIDGSTASKADIDDFRKHFKIADAKEITKEEYKILQVEYCKCKEHSKLER